MGKAALLLVLSALVAGALIMYQSEQTSFETYKDQGERQEELVAREIARSGFNALRARVREVEEELYEFNANIPLSQVILQVNDGTNNRPELDYEGGRYTIWMERVGVDAYRLNSIGHYGSAQHRLSGTSLLSTMGTSPEDDPPLGGGIVDDLEGVCGALFVQKHMPITDSGVGGYEDGDYTNPLNPSHGEEDDYAQRSARYMRLDPEMVFPSGNSDTHPRDATIANIITTMPAGTRLGFVLAVDENCSLVDAGWDASLEEFDTRYYSIVAHQAGRTGREGDGRAGGQGTVGNLEEGNNVLIEQNENEEYLWRVAFEADQSWSSETLLAAKDALSEKEKGLDGFVDLQSDPNGPDFTDFIVEFWMTNEYDLAQHAPGHESMDVCLLSDGCGDAE